MWCCVDSSPTAQWLRCIVVGAIVRIAILQAVSNLLRSLNGVSEKVDLDRAKNGTLWTHLLSSSGAPTQRLTGAGEEMIIQVKPFWLDPKGTRVTSHGGGHALLLERHAFECGQPYSAKLRP
jgi:hypothetical protein